MKVDVSAKLINMPRHCACCAGAATTELRATASKKRGKTSESNSWGFPYCAACAAHVRRYSAAFGVLAGGVVVAAIGMMFYSRWWAAIAIPAAGGCLALLNSARAMRTRSCVCTGAAVIYLGWHGTLHSFRFVSPGYATQFMLANRSKLVNLTPSQQQLLGGTGNGSSSVDRQIRRRA